MYDILFSYFGSSDSGHAFKLVRCNSEEEGRVFLGIENNYLWKADWIGFRGFEQAIDWKTPELMWEFEYINPNYEG